MKIDAGHFLIRRKGTLNWMPSTSSEEPIVAGEVNGRNIYLPSKNIVPPKVKHSEPPHLPQHSWHSSLPRSVILHGMVDVDGKIRFAHADQSPGEDFTKESLRVLEKWCFEPAHLNGQPVPALIVIQMEFL